MKVVRVCTHHKHKHEAAEAFIKDNVVAVGFVYDRNDALNASKDQIKQKRLDERPYETEKQAARAASDFCRFRDEIKPGFIVIAYEGDNTVAAIGKINDSFDFNDRNATGNPNGPLYYTNQFPVKWERSHRFFNRSELVPELDYWVAIPGTIYIKKDFEVDSIDELFNSSRK